MGTRVQINLRVPTELYELLISEAQRRDMTRNALVVRCLRDQLYEGQAVPIDDAGVVIKPKPVAPIVESGQMTRRHLHRFVEVDDTRSPGRLLGETEATYECVCGKSERRKVR